MKRSSNRRGLTLFLTILLVMAALTVARSDMRWLSRSYGPTVENATGGGNGANGEKAGSEAAKSQQWSARVGSADRVPSNAPAPDFTYDGIYSKDRGAADLNLAKIEAYKEGSFNRVVFTFSVDEAGTKPAEEPPAFRIGQALQGQVVEIQFKGVRWWGARQSQASENLPPLVKDVRQAWRGSSLSALVQGYGRVEYRAFSLANPARIVIDVREPQLPLPSLSEQDKVAAKAAVEAFMKARIKTAQQGVQTGEARVYLTGKAENDYSSGPDMTLYGTSNPRFSRYALRSASAVWPARMLFVARIYEKTQDVGETGFFEEVLTAIRKDSGFKVDSAKRTTYFNLPRTGEGQKAWKTLERYLEARLKRDAETAWSLYTPSLRKELSDKNPDAKLLLSGPSNPHPYRYEILSSGRGEGGRIDFDVRLYEEYTGQGETGYTDVHAMLIPSGGDYLIDATK